jgi:hypothetical protein
LLPATAAGISHEPPLKQAVAVEHADLDEPRWKQHRDRQRIREDFEERERARGRAQATNEPERKAPAMADDRELKALVSRGFSEATARAILAGKIASPVRMPVGGGWILD